MAHPLVNFEILYLINENQKNITHLLKAQISLFTKLPQVFPFYFWEMCLQVDEIYTKLILRFILNHLTIHLYNNIEIWKKILEIQKKHA